MLNQIEISENERAENISTDKFIELINIFEGRWGTWWKKAMNF